MNKKNIRVCRGRTCSRRGSDRIMETLAKNYQISPGTSAGEADLDYRDCTGYCEHGPNVVADNKIYHQSRTRDIVKRITEESGAELKKPELDDELFTPFYL